MQQSLSSLGALGASWKRRLFFAYMPTMKAIHFDHFRAQTRSFSSHRSILGMPLYILYYTDVKLIFFLGYVIQCVLGRTKLNPADQKAIFVDNLHKSFATLEVLKGVSLSAEKGEIIAIIGGSESGKFTLLRCINFHETPTSGDIYISGEKIQMKADGSPADQKQIEHLRPRVARVFQSFNL